MRRALFVAGYALLLVFGAACWTVLIRFWWNTGALWAS